MFNEQDLLMALRESYSNYKRFGPRSNQKLKPIHRFIAERVVEIWGEDFSVEWLDTGERAVEGLYYEKRVDISVSEKKNDKIVMCLGIKFVMSNYKQNAINYFESMLGETANIQVKNIPYFHIVILRKEFPYYNRNGEVEKIEVLSEKDLLKYVRLVLDNFRWHRPYATALLIIHIDDDNVSIVSPEDFVKENTGLVNIMKEKLSLENLFKEMSFWKSFAEQCKL